MRTYSEVSLEKSMAELAEYELTWQDWQAIQQSCRQHLDDLYVIDLACEEHNATRLAETVAWELDPSPTAEWLADETHPVWDAAAHFCEAADADS